MEKPHANSVNLPEYASIEPWSNKQEFNDFTTFPPFNLHFKTAKNQAKIALPSRHKEKTRKLLPKKCVCKKTLQRKTFIIILYHAIITNYIKWHVKEKKNLNKFNFYESILWFKKVLYIKYSCINKEMGPWVYFNSNFNGPLL